MIINKEDEHAFRDYDESLRLLESAFVMAGLDICFECIVDKNYGKAVEVSKKGSTAFRYIGIEGDSPAQALKDVANGVRL